MRCSFPSRFLLSFRVRGAFLPAAFAGLAAAVGIAPAHAQSSLYTSSSSFLAAVQPGYYTETFTQGGADGGGSFSYSGNGYGYTVTAGGSAVYRSGDFIGTNNSNTTLTITFTQGNVTGIGGNFFNTDMGNAFQAIPVTITLSDNTTTTFTPTSAADYRGFTSDTNTTIASLTLGAPGGGYYTGFDNLTVATSVLATIHTSPASFAAATLPGSYTETFTQAGRDRANSFSYFGNSYGYTVTAGGGSDVYRSGSFIGANEASSSLIVSFTTGNVTSVGGNFFNTDMGDVFQATPVTITLNDGTTTTYTPSSAADFRGFTTITNTPITSLTFSAPGAGQYASLDNLTVGTSVISAPEPGSIVLVCFGALPVAGTVVRRRCRHRKTGCASARA